MKSYKLSMLATVIALTVSGVSQADQSESHAHFDKKIDNASSYKVNVAKKQGKSLLPSFKSDFFGFAGNGALGQLLNDSQANIKLRTVYFNQRNPKAGEAGADSKIANAYDNKWSGSALGAQFNFYSGYAWNHLGFDWSLFAVQQISRKHNKDYADGEFLSKRTDGKMRTGLVTPDAMADIKFKAGDDDLNVNAKAGLIDITSEFMATSGTRAVPSGYRGIAVNGNAYGVNWYANMANGIRLRGVNGLHDFTNANGKNISFIGEAGGKYTLDNGIGLNLVYGEGRDYIKQYMGSASYTLTLSQESSLKLQGAVYQAKKGGSLWDTTKTQSPEAFGSRANANTLSANYLLGGLNVGIAYTKTKAKGGAGHYQYLLAHNDYGNWNAKTDVDDDFNYDGENAYQASINYKFDQAGIPGLEASIIYTNGSGINYKNNNRIEVRSQHEYDYLISYQFQQDNWLKNLKLSGVLYDLYQKGANQTSNTNGGGNQQKYGNSHSTDLRLYADYTVAVF